MKRYQYDEEWGVLMIIGFALVILAATLYTTANGQGLDESIPEEYTQYLPPLTCEGLPYTPMDTYIGENVDHLGRIHFDFDANNDGVMDSQFTHDVSDGRRLPRFYMYDKNFDGEPDIRFEDYALDGTCDHMHIVWERGKTPQARPDVTPPSRHEGTPIPEHGPQCKEEEA